MDCRVKPGNDGGNRGTSVQHPFDRDWLLVWFLDLKFLTRSRQQWKALQIHHTRYFQSSFCKICNRCAGVRSRFSQAAARAGNNSR
jgi:hypothetical protein